MLLVNKIYNKDEDCPICFENMCNTLVSSTSCNHHFHKSCLEQQFSSTHLNRFSCSICRNSLWENIPVAQQELYENIFTEDNSSTDRWGSDMVEMLIRENRLDFGRSLLQSPRPNRRLR